MLRFNHMQAFVHQQCDCATSEKPVLSPDSKPENPTLARCRKLHAKSGAQQSNSPFRMGSRHLDL